MIIVVLLKPLIECNKTFTISKKLVTGGDLNPKRKKVQVMSQASSDNPPTNNYTLTIPKKAT